MRIQQFLAHHGVAANPFAEEDAQTDPVFKEHCIGSTFHTTWDKIYGDPAEPATSVVFGEKGSGKTALRLQIVRHLAEHNRLHPERRVFVIEYDDFNPFLDRFRDALSVRRRRAERALAEWKLWDHMDAILALGVTRLIDWALHGQGADGAAATGGPHGGELDLGRLSRHQARDLLLLAALYDRSSAETYRQRWTSLRRKLRFRTWRTWWPVVVGIGVTLSVAGLIVGQQQWQWLASPAPYLCVLAGWAPWLYRLAAGWLRARRVARQLRVIEKDPEQLRRLLTRFTRDELSGQPLPHFQRSDDRFELLLKFQGILRTLGYPGVIVLVDRVDEPHLINGSPEQMRALVWPLLDNKFLKHPGIGFKLLLPVELSYFIEREDREFYQRARLDKQNMIPSLQWTGEALYDLATARLKACAMEGRTPSLRSFFEDAVSERRLMEALRSLRVPRHLFKFFYRLFVAHAHAHTDDEPVWQISGATFERELALYQRDQDAFDRGVGAG